MKLSFLLKGMIPTSQGFQVWGKIPFVQSSSIQVKGRSTVSLIRKAFMLETAGSSTLFPCENWVSFWKSYLQSESILKWEDHSLYEKYLLHTKWRNTCIIWKNSICVRKVVSCTLFTYVNWVTIF
jgi:hypothetical protein